MRRLFDDQVSKIIRLIDNQIRRLSESPIYSSERISKIVLSGGLGSSHYVRAKISAQYASNGIELVLAAEPQLAVVKGIVVDRLQRVSHGQSALSTRCCRASYGIVCRQPYDKGRHKGQPPIKDPINGEKYVEDQINWLVKQGEVLPVDRPIQHDFYRILAPDAQRGVWRDKIAMSKVPAHLLPHKAEPKYIFCHIDSDLRNIPLEEFTEKKKRWWQRGSCHVQANYQVKVVIDAAHLRFELWHNGRNYTRENRIAVELGPAAAENVEGGQGTMNM